MDENDSKRALLDALADQTQRFDPRAASELADLLDALAYEIEVNPVPEWKVAARRMLVLERAAVTLRGADLTRDDTASVVAPDMLLDLQVDPDGVEVIPAAEVESAEDGG